MPRTNRPKKRKKQTITFQSKKTKLNSKKAKQKLSSIHVISNLPNQTHSYKLRPRHHNLSSLKKHSN